MKAHTKVDAGVCGFKTKITAVARDKMQVDLRIGSNCKTIKTLARLIRSHTPINAIQELSPQVESTILAVCRPILQKKGGCEGCVVPVAIHKTMQVAANLALPRDVHLEITKTP